MTPDLKPLLGQVPEDVLGICRRLREKGKRGWIVGGCVRDLLRGAPAKDWDVATDARPEDVVRMFPKVIPTGLQHGTVTVVKRGVHYEVTTLRGDGADEAPVAESPGQQRHAPARRELRAER